MAKVDSVVVLGGCNIFYFYVASAYLANIFEFTITFLLRGHIHQQYTFH